MEKCASVELKQAYLGDTGRNKRLVRILEDLGAQPTQ
ncbi:hypothetical protein DP113_27530 [Brasilonema octagenarum UFV-E1]|uniref:Transposase Tn5-like N-terminal domain-containing protein n=2 Tax=Brasilonema TaxID=383614 RepID=A0A856MM34_9CYAN|nr:hypothetical protein [Brasilonema octagenarum UFV-OR1]QDL11154.1 hypothetical protein DP114_27600 [Brasilonema sennae CENA114]QDL17500.1 hypothetical protein DP113_27530 [Brasilonema octagenarum UFV-E1]